MSLRKKHSSLLSTGSTPEDSRRPDKAVDRRVKNRFKTKQKYSWICFKTGGGGGGQNFGH